MNNDRISEAKTILSQHVFDASSDNWQSGLIALALAPFDIDKVIRFYSSMFDKGTFDSHLPIHGFMLWKIYEQQSDNQDLIERISHWHPHLVRHHLKYYSDQNPMDNGLITSTGCNTLTNKASSWLLNGNTDEIADQKPVIDPIFNSIVSLSNEALIELGYALELDSADLFEQNEQTIHSMNELLWNKETGLFDALDITSSKTISIHSSLGFIPLIAGIPAIDQVLSMIQRLFGDDFRQEGHYSIPFGGIDQGLSDLESPSTISLILNWLIGEGLRRYAMDDLAEIVIEDSLDLINRFGFYTAFTSDKAMIDNGFDSATSELAAAIYLDMSTIQLELDQ